MEFRDAVSMICAAHGYREAFYVGAMYDDDGFGVVNVEEPVHAYYVLSAAVLMDVWDKLDPMDARMHVEYVMDVCHDYLLAMEERAQLKDKELH